MSSQARALVRPWQLVWVLAACMIGGCLDRKLKPLNPCLVSAVTQEIAVNNIDKVDMLFMVDNSNSMREEQARLQEQFPHLIQVLTSGHRDDDPAHDFRAARDLHIGVVSSDMGLPGVTGYAHCDDFGDDGRLLHEPRPAAGACKASYPTFLSFIAGTDTPEATAADFACIATLGTGGCGFEQQLEAPLKALWPSIDPLPREGKNRIVFYGDEAHQLGHGDTDNIGFLRNDPLSPSLLAIVIVTDEEDCSSSDMHHFTKDPNDPVSQEGFNLRCHNHPKELYELERYVNGFKALRPGDPNLVVFAAIAGVPPDLVDGDHLSAVDFAKDAEREAFYEGVLNDSRMQEVVDPSAAMGTGNIRPSCLTNDENGEVNSGAAPPRRIVEVARGFGKNGVVQSICQDDFGPALDAIIKLIAENLGDVCLPRPLVRNADGLVECNVVWELPPASERQGDTPVRCGEPGWEFLLDPGPDHVRASKRGGAICKVAQLAVQADAMGVRSPVPTLNEGRTFESGWYYDDFSAERLQACRYPVDIKQRVAFKGQNGRPPTGVVVKLECLNETQRLPNNRVDVVTSPKQPAIGDACDQITAADPAARDAACAVRLLAPSARWPNMIDTSMFCHPQLNVCVLSCSNDADCPAAWVCDDRGETRAQTGDRNVCVNPTCGTQESE